MWCLKKDFYLTGIFFFVLVILLLLNPLTRISYAQSELLEIRDMWKMGNYDEVLPRLLEYRNKPYGKNAAVDYMIATSACRLSDHEETGYKFFNWILKNYSLGKNRELVENEQEKCASNSQPSNLAFTSLRTGGSVGVSGKTYYWLGNEKSLEGETNALIASDPVEVVKEISFEKLSERLFEKSNRPAAESFFKEQLDPTFKVKAFRYFTIASSGNHSASQLNSINRTLESYLGFFALQYDMPVPSYLITVYLVPELGQLRNLAEKIHGIRVSRGSIGYSFRDDLSLVGVIPSTTLGTLAHELFHLMSRNNFGDIPPWLDEGMASLYEVSEVSDDRILGLPNWRGAVLKQFWSMRPSIKELIEMDWHSFDGFEDSFEKKAANHATARYFILYLQNQQKLMHVYEAFQARDILSKDPDSPSMNPKYLIESIMEQPLSKIDENFTQWFQQF